MGIEELLPLLMFPLLFILIISGMQVAFALIGTSLAFALIGHSFDIFLLSDFGFLPARIFGVIQNFTLLAVPLFIFMGITLERSKLAEDLLQSVAGISHRLPGGITLAVVCVGALLAASTGIVGATVVTMGVLSLPAMLERNYDKPLACGAICAAGTLGQIVPPSIVLVILGDMMNVAVADLFAGTLIPALILVVLYLGYIIIRTGLNPDLCPVSDKDLGRSTKELATNLIPPIILIILVLGSILFGIASPTESAACGAGGALSIAAVRRRLSLNTLREISDDTTSMTSMVFLLLVGAQFFSVVFRGLYGDDVIAEIIQSLDFSPGVILFLLMVLLFVLGFFLDFIEICFIVVPIIEPLLVGELGYDPLWLAVIIAVNLQTSFLTPPFGFSLFYLKRRQRSHR